MQHLKIAIVQHSPKWEKTNDNLKKLDILFQKLEKDTDLVILPEMFNTGFSMNTQIIAEKMDGQTSLWMQKWSEHFGICGSIAIQENKLYYNRLQVFSKGKLIGKYDKKHLFSLAKEEHYYSAGKEQLQLQIAGFNLAFYICYDLRFPEWIRNTANYDAAIFVASWPNRRIKHWDALLQARAIENQSYIIGCNRTGKDGNDFDYSGHSQIVLPNGEIVKKTSKKTELLYHVLEKDMIKKTRRTLPFLKDMDV